MNVLRRAMLSGGWIHRWVRHPLWIGLLAFEIVFTQLERSVAVIDGLLGTQLERPSVYPASFWSAIAVGAGASLVACCVSRARHSGSRE